MNTGWRVRKRELSGSGQGQYTAGPWAPERQDDHTDGPSQHPGASTGHAQEGQGCWGKQASRQEEGSAGHPPWDGAVQRTRSEGQRGRESRQGHFTGETNEWVGSSCDPREGGCRTGPRACCKLLSWRGRRGPSMPTSAPLSCRSQPTHHPARHLPSPGVHYSSPPCPEPGPKSDPKPSLTRLGRQQPSPHLPFQGPPYWRRLGAALGYL